MKLWLGFAKRENGTAEKEVFVIHLFGRHLAVGGGFRDNYGSWHDDVRPDGQRTVEAPVFCKCGREV